MNEESVGLDVQQCGRYRIVDVIGRGGMATVYRAVLDGPLGFSRSVAIKQIRTDQETRSERFERALVNEARLGSRLRHPNLVDVLEFGQEDGIFYIVMELVEGMTLAGLIHEASERQVAVPRKLCLQIVADIATGLAYAHGLRDENGKVVGLIHRDLKPGNILVSRSGQVLVADFGLAKSDANMFQSTSVEVKGTPAYMSPEQVTCRPLTPASDLFSLGTILYELLRGEPLFAADNVLAVVNRIAQDPMEQERQWVRSHAPEFVGLVERLLEKAPTDRPQSADMVAREARELLRGYPAEVSLSDFMGWIGDESASADSPPDAGVYVQPVPTVEDTVSVSSTPVAVPGSDVAARTADGRIPLWFIGLAVAVVLSISVLLVLRTMRAPRNPAGPEEPTAADLATVGPSPVAIESSGTDLDDSASSDGDVAGGGGEAGPAEDPAGVEVAVAEVFPVENVVEIAPPNVTIESSMSAEPVVSQPIGVASLKIDCRPWCDRIEVDGESWGESPQLKREAPLGRREVRLYAAKGEEKVLQVEMAEGGTKVCWDFDRGAACEGF